VEVPLNVRSLVHRYTLHDCTVTCLPGIAGLVVSSNFTTALALVWPPLLTANMTVRFADAVSWLADQDVRDFVEVGPDGVLCGMARESLPDAAVVPLLRRSGTQFFAA